MIMVPYRVIFETWIGTFSNCLLYVVQEKVYTSTRLVDSTKITLRKCVILCFLS